MSTQRPARTRSRLRPAKCAVAAVFVGALFGCGEAPAIHVQAQVLHPLDLGGVRLLPRATAMAPPKPRAAVTHDIPAFDRPYVTLDQALSYSIGTTSEGYLAHGEPLADAPGLRVRSVSKRRGALYGTAGLNAALQRAARSVAEAYPGSMLYAGDLSAAGGGDLPGHTSHNSGRDADVAFYMRNGDGTHTDSARFRLIGLGGAASEGPRFDDGRNWALVEALLRDPSVQVQWIFAAAHLEERLLAYADAVERPKEIVARAARVLLQPKGASPHADHFHIRLYCGEEERLQGCLDAAPFHPWVDRYDAEVARWVDGLTPFLGVGWTEEFEYAVNRLVRLQATRAIPKLTRIAAKSRDIRVIQLATDAVAFLEGERTPDQWKQWRPEDVGD